MLAALEVHGRALTAIFMALNLGPDGAPRLAIPVATDIAFALAALAVAARRLPPPLRIFLLTLAIVDDLGAVAIIALAYTEEVRWTALAGPGGAGRARPDKAWRRAPFLFYGVGFAWSGASPCSRGSTPPSRRGVRPGNSYRIRVFPGAGQRSEVLHGQPTPLCRLRRHPAALRLRGGGIFLRRPVAPADHFTPLPLGIVLALVIGRLGCSASRPLAVGLKLGPGRRGHMAGDVRASVLCGVGFTMSLFIGSLPLGPTRGAMGLGRLGVVTGSILAAPDRRGDPEPGAEAASGDLA